MTQELLDLRKAMNAKRPEFVVGNKYRRIRVSRSSWRAPRGRHNKEKLGVHGKKAVVKVGYRNPRLVRGLARSGLLPVRVSNLAALLLVDPKTQCVLIAHVGMKKRVELLNACKAKNIVVANFVVEDALSNIASKLDERKKHSAAARKRKESKKEVKPKEEKAAVEDDAKKELERKEMEKVLTRREK